MKKFTASVIALALLMAFSLTANAQALRNASERASDHKQIQRDQATLQRDQQELAQFSGLRKGLGDAVQSGNVGLAKGYQMKLVNAMEREVQQGEAKIALASKEVVQSQSEVRSDRRELSGDRRNGRPLQAADDRRDKRDDKADLHDDKNDLAEAKVRTARQKEILGAFKSVTVNGPEDVNALWAKKNLLDEFENTMRRDMGENLEELHEDKQELREDRRETNEDRRQR